MVEARAGPRVCLTLAGPIRSSARCGGRTIFPSTGSAAGSLGAYLVRHGKLAPGHTLSILQGVEMGRPSHIEVQVSQSGKKLVPRVSGAAVKVFEGSIRV